MACKRFLSFNPPKTNTKPQAKEKTKTKSTLKFEEIVSKASNDPTNDLRAYKVAAHNAMDRLWWRKGKKSRDKVYSWLASELGLAKDKCHISFFDIDTCKRVIELCIKRQEMITNKQKLEKS
jgi:zinc-finger-containing domain